MAQLIVGSKLPANNSYGQNGDPGPSSTTNVPASSKLTKFRASGGGAALDKLIGEGVRSKANDAPQEVVGQERPISDAPIALAMGMESAAERQPSTNKMSVSRRLNTPQLKP